MDRKKLILLILIFICLAAGLWFYQKADISLGYFFHEKGISGSESCRRCHEKFYKLWATSHHGLAMQPFTQEFAKTQLAEQTNDIVIGEYRYLADLSKRNGRIIERGPEGKKKYPIEHVLGGKNVYYFLTPMERGKLQVLPIAFDVRKKEWFDTTASGVRHLTDGVNEAIDWKERQLTFNTSCYGCHVSQLATNYDLETDSYHTTWTEPGINCESCHGPGREHVRVCDDAPKGQPPKDLKLIVTKQFTAEQKNTMCGSCHAKMIPFKIDFMPGDRFFDHFDLIGFEHSDFYPDGRDLGENYTYNLWLTSPCVQSGELDCMHCHTSSGRYKFGEESANDACMPCHENLVKDPASHSHHLPNSTGSKCISCHMPKTSFARMQRHDHSMLAPTPATTIAFNSPNACNICHKDHDAIWADKFVSQWYRSNYQAQVLHRARLIDAARKRDWTRLPEMLAYIEAKDQNEIYVTSLIRLLESCREDYKWPVIINALQNPSPLVRAAAASALSQYLNSETLVNLLSATRDEYALVRVRAAAALAGIPPELLNEQARKDLDDAVEEFKATMKARPDDSASYYNLGNFYVVRGQLDQAVASFKIAIKLQPDSIPYLVNASIAYARLGQIEKAEESLAKAIELNPTNAVVNFNLGLLLGELGRKQEAEAALKRALEVDPELAPAAYNLCIIIGTDRIQEATSWCQKAYKLRPEEPNYGYVYAFYLRQNGDNQSAIKVLKDLIEKQPNYKDAYTLLGQIYQEQGKTEEAKQLQIQALENK